MFGDKPEEEFGPDIPSVDIPSVNVPRVNGPRINAKDVDSVDVPTRLKLDFWLLVIVFNIALLAFGVGVMLIVFEQRWAEGLHLIGFGITTFMIGLRYCTKAKRRHRD